MLSNYLTVIFLLIVLLLILNTIRTDVLLPYLYNLPSCTIEQAIKNGEKFSIIGGLRKRKERKNAG